MTLLDSSSSASVAADGHVEARFGDRATRLHPQWLREQSTEPGQIEATNRQRLFTPLDVEPGLVAVDAELDGDTLTVAFSDGHRCRLSVAALRQRLGWVADPEAPPAPSPGHPARSVPTVSWPAIAGSLDEPGVAQATVDFLGDFARHGFVIIRDTPTTEGTVAEVANHIGYIAGNNFGWVFDVRNEPKPTDLAYTAIELKPHTDQPYRKVQPGLQLLHCLATRRRVATQCSSMVLRPPRRCAANSPTSTRRSPPSRSTSATTWAPTWRSTDALWSNLTRPAGSVSSASTPSSTSRFRPTAPISMPGTPVAGGWPRGWTILPIRLPSVLVEAI